MGRELRVDAAAGEAAAAGVRPVKEKARACVVILGLVRRGTEVKKRDWSLGAAVRHDRQINLEVLARRRGERAEKAMAGVAGSVGMVPGRAW